MTIQLIHAEQIYTQKGQIISGYVKVENGIIAEVSTKRPHIDGPYEYLECPPDKVLAPGFVDTHVHALKGYDTITPDALGLTQMCRNHLPLGVTAFCPTTMTESVEAINASLNNVAQVKTAMDKKIAAGTDTGARIVGINLEGPFIDADKKGAQPESNIQL